MTCSIPDGKKSRDKGQEIQVDSGCIWRRVPGAQTREAGSGVRRKQEVSDTVKGETTDVIG